MNQSILTAVGRAKLMNATPEQQLLIAHIAVGDGDGRYQALDENMTTLVREVWRGPASAPMRDAANPALLLFSVSLPPDAGDFFVREIAIFDAAGDMIGIGQTHAVQQVAATPGNPGAGVTAQFAVQLQNAGQVDLVYTANPLDIEARVQELVENDDYLLEQVAHKLQSYTALLAYRGASELVRITGFGISGVFQYDQSLPNLSDGGTLFAHASGVGAWSRCYSGLLNVRWWGAKGNSVSDDTLHIQNAIDACVGRILFFPDGEYRTTAPIYLYSGSYIYGNGRASTSFFKSTDTVGVGSNAAPLHDFVDHYNKNAVLIIKHPDNNFAYNVRIKDISVNGKFLTVNLGIYAPRCSDLALDNVLVRWCKDSFETHDCWMSKFDRVECNAETRDGEGGITGGWPETTRGFIFKGSDPDHATGTSCTFNSCWARECHVGWDIEGLKYSTLNCSGSDHISGIPYRLISSNLTLNSCAAEGVLLSNGAVLLSIASKLSVNTFQTYNISAKDSGVSAAIWVQGGEVVFSASEFEDYRTPGGAVNYIIENGAQVVATSTKFPTNGVSYTSYSDGATLTILGGASPRIESESGIKQFAFV